MQKHLSFTATTERDSSGYMKNYVKGKKKINVCKLSKGAPELMAKYVCKILKKQIHEDQMQKQC